MKIFIKTYDKDAEWLKYALQSIQVHASDYASDVIVATEGLELGRARRARTWAHTEMPAG